jgi:hypothetical protein
MSTKEHFLELNNKTRRTDNFVIEFLGFPENVSNVLGRQTKSIARPSISFNPSETRFRGSKYMDKGAVEFQPVNISFHDDENSVTSSLLYAQIFRQLDKFKDINGLFPGQNYKERDFRFGIRVKLYNSMEEIVEEYTLKNCFITEINHDDPELPDDSESILNITVAFDNIEMNVFDEYLSILSDQ